jgi:hypothetical protein
MNIERSDGGDKRVLPMTSQRWSVGSIVAIEIEKDRFCYGLLLEQPHIAIFEGVYGPGFTPSDESLADAKVLFIICIYRYVISKSIWKKVGQAPTLAKRIEIPPFYVYDRSSNRYWISFKDGKRIPATREECIRLEREAVWESDAVEDRIRDTIAGRPNKWLEAMQNY